MRKLEEEGYQDRIELCNTAALKIAEQNYDLRYLAYVGPAECTRGTLISILMKSLKMLHVVATVIFNFFDEIFCCLKN